MQNAMIAVERQGVVFEDCPKSNRPVAVRQPRFAVFVDASYSQRYQLLMSKLVRERLYDSACFLMSSRDSGTKGRYTHLEPELSFVQFAALLPGRIASHLAAKRGP